MRILPFSVRPAHKRNRSLPALEWLEEAVGLSARATVVDGRNLLVENHTGVLDFSPDRVLLSTRRGALCVHGAGLSLCDMRPGTLIVRGDIHRVELPCEGGDPFDEG